VVLRFTPERSRWVRGELWQEGESEEVLENGSLVKTIPASHGAEILMEILRHGSHVEVLEPNWLREKVVEELSAAVRNYGM
jgi:predicted DNA-binding transcriptional regulator YafY